MKKTRILGIYINNRVMDAVLVQDILTRYGCSIKTRLGLHEVTNEHCSTTGLILLELTGEEKEMDDLERDLKGVAELQIQKMEFNG